MKKKKNMCESTIRKTDINERTPNGKFGVMAAVAPQTILCGNERLYPAGSSVDAATTPSHRSLCASCLKLLYTYEEYIDKNRFKW